MMDVESCYNMKEAADEVVVAIKGVLDEFDCDDVLEAGTHILSEDHPALVSLRASMQSADRDLLVDGVPTHKHTFCMVFRREWGDDQGYITKLMNVIDEGNHADMSLTAAILNQIKGEIDQNPKFKDKFRFSHSILFVGAQYYVLGELEYETSHKDAVAAWKEFTDEQHFQRTYDEYGMAGHYELVGNTPELIVFIGEARRTESFPVPSWVAG